MTLLPSSGLISNLDCTSTMMFRWLIPDDGGRTHLWNVGRQSSYTAVYPRRQLWTSYSPPWKLPYTLIYVLPLCWQFRIPVHTRRSSGVSTFSVAKFFFNRQPETLEDIINLCPWIRLHLTGKNALASLSMWNSHRWNISQFKLWYAGWLGWSW
jgi:hypothetical protein